jgi:hydroxymethylpyrimidine pyrophosphatase-like HAD family hydrolase
MIIAVDFDGTIVEHEYPRIGKPIPFAIEVLKKLQTEDHHVLILWTMRENDLLQDAIDYCEKRGLKFYAHNKNHPEEEYGSSSVRKLAADLYIDDRNVGGLFDWGIIYQIIKSGVNRIDNLDMLENTAHKKKKNWFIRTGEAMDKAKRERY